MLKYDWPSEAAILEVRVYTGCPKKPQKLLKSPVVSISMP